MGFLDSIEKLINEHGSAVILRERITLAHEQFAVLEKKATDLQLKVDGLKSENDSLKVDKLTLEKKVRNLEEQLVERRGQRLEEIREKLLTALSSGHELKAHQCGANNLHHRCSPRLLVIASRHPLPIGAPHLWRSNYLRTASVFANEMLCEKLTVEVRAGVAASGADRGADNVRGEGYWEAWREHYRRRSPSAPC